MAKRRKETVGYKSDAEVGIQGRRCRQGAGSRAVAQTLIAPLFWLSPSREAMARHPAAAAGAGGRGRAGAALAGLWWWAQSPPPARPDHRAWPRQCHRALALPAAAARNVVFRAAAAGGAWPRQRVHGRVHSGSIAALRHVAARRARALSPPPWPAQLRTPRHGWRREPLDGGLADQFAC